MLWKWILVCSVKGFKTLFQLKYLEMMLFVVQLWSISTEHSYSDLNYFICLFFLITTMLLWYFTVKMPTWLKDQLKRHTRATLIDALCVTLSSMSDRDRSRQRFTILMTTLCAAARHQQFTYSEIWTHESDCALRYVTSWSNKKTNYRKILNYRKL